MTVTRQAGWGVGGWRAAQGNAWLNFHLSQFRTHNPLTEELAGRLGGGTGSAVAGVPSDGPTPRFSTKGTRDHLTR